MGFLAVSIATRKQAGRLLQGSHEPAPPGEIWQPAEHTDAAIIACI